MIDLNTVNKIYLFTGNTDFRYGIYGLSKIVLSQFNKQDIKHNLFKPFLKREYRGKLYVLKTLCNRVERKVLNIWQRITQKNSYR